MIWGTGDLHGMSPADRAVYSARWRERRRTALKIVPRCVRSPRATFANPSPPWEVYARQVNGKWTFR